jgi:thiamine kinase-like enzyme
MEIDLLDIKKEIDSLPSVIFKCKFINSKELKLLKIGQKNLNIYFKVNKKEYLFRINIKDYNKNNCKKLKSEYNALNLLSKYKIDKGPKVIFFSKKGTFFSSAYMIITYLKGNEVKLNKLNIKIIAKKIALINKTKLSLKDKLLVSKQKLDALSIEFINKEKYITKKQPKLLDFFRKIRLNIEKNSPKNLNDDIYLIHGDLTLRNMIYYKRVINFIDWEYLKLGNPLLDIAKLSHSNNFIKYESYFFKEYKKYFDQIDYIYEKYLFFRDYQIYLWLVSSTKYYFEIIYENNRCTLKSNKKDIVKDIIKNYKYLYKKKYASVSLLDLKNFLNI